MEEAMTVLMDAWEENEVDQLLKRVAEIREQCDHDFRLTKEVVLEESRVLGVYFAGIFGGHSPLMNAFVLPLRCLKCSVESRPNCMERCPRCLGKMRLEGVFDREEYFGERYDYYAAAVYRCESCRFALVIDEWDQ